MPIKQWGFFNVPAYFDIGHPFIMVISEDPWHSQLMLICFNDIDLSRTGIEFRSPACEANNALQLSHHGGENMTWQVYRKIDIWQAIDNYKQQKRSGVSSSDKLKWVLYKKQNDIPLTQFCDSGKTTNGKK